MLLKNGMQFWRHLHVQGGNSFCFSPGFHPPNPVILYHYVQINVTHPDVFQLHLTYTSQPLSPLPIAEAIALTIL